ncbi:MAG: AIPR family protein [Candidatus Falkowbacteria bacterium]
MSIKILLERRVKEFVKDYPEFNKEPINRKFLFFSAFNLLKDLKVSYDEIVDGIIDGSDDYGIDALYIFSSGILLAEDDNLNDQIAKDDKIKIQLIQVTRNPGFSETAFLKTKNGIEYIFNMKKKLEGNANFISKGELIRKVWERCFQLGSVKNIEIEVIFVSMSSDEKIGQKIKNIEKDISVFLKKEQLKNLNFIYAGIPALYKLIAAESYEKEIMFKDITTYAESFNPDVIGYYGLVKLKDFLLFISEKDGKIAERYFEGNIRDFYGLSKKVNQKIKTTILTKDKINFWCLNNGITIICDNANPLGKKLKLFNFHIVNGCQTAHVIYECRKEIKNDDQSEILVKVIQTRSEDIANDIIDATNSQTSVTPISLHSNDLVQKNIQEHFLKHSKKPLFYERRLNYYKRRSKPANRIVSMMKLFQVFYSVFEKKPSVARGRPTETFEKSYDNIFDTAYDYDAYLFSYLLFLKLASINREAKRKNQKEDVALIAIRKYGIFHVSRIIFALLIKDDGIINLKEKNNRFIVNKSKILKAMQSDKKMKSFYDNSIKILQGCLDKFKAKESGLDYNIFKNEELDKKINKQLAKNIKS